MNKYKKLSSDLRNKFLLIGIVPVLIVSIFLFGKIYFMLEEVGVKSHSKILKDIDFYTDSLLDEIKDETIYLQKNFKNVDLDKFVKANKDIETLLIYDKKTKKLLNLSSDFNITEDMKDRYLLENSFRKYNKIKEATFDVVHNSIDNTHKSIAYVMPTEDCIFVFDLNINVLKPYIKYLHSSVDYIIVIVDKEGNYIINTSKEKYFKDNFFKTEYYTKFVTQYDQFEYDEFENEEQDEDNYVMYYKSKETGWIIAVIELGDTLDDQVLSLLPFVVLLIPILIIIIFILAKQYTNNIINPLEILITKMEKLATSTNVDQINIDHFEYSLFKRIVVTFNKMQNKIIKRENELKESNELLTEKTKEVSKLNSRLQLDITKEIEKNRRKDQQLIEQSRLAQMGEMISMIAHQWRQPLAAISSTGTAIGLKAKLNKLDNKTAIDLSGKIVSYSAHLSSTIDDFREFFKENKEKKEITYEELIKSVLGIIEVSLSNKNIKLIQNLNSNCVFNTFPNELKQVILNLIKNAEDILLENEIPEPKIIIETNDNVLTIRDNAGGVPVEIMHKIFDPYFSTKLEKNGTGLGLYMSKTIIEEHCNGTLSVENDKDGAVFTIVLNNAKKDEDKKDS